QYYQYYIPPISSFKTFLYPFFCHKQHPSNPSGEAICADFHVTKATLKHALYTFLTSASEAQGQRPLLVVRAMFLSRQHTIIASPFRDTRGLDSIAVFSCPTKPSLTDWDPSREARQLDKGYWFLYCRAWPALFSLGNLDRHQNNQGNSKSKTTGPGLHLVTGLNQILCLKTSETKSFKVHC
ncbi:uncharacterized protein VP01_5529g1, partial [Puccinia sorghi]